MVFLESTQFQGQREEHLDDEEFRALQNELINHPGKGSLIRGSGGLRKIRFGSGRRGKRGALRIIYYWMVSADIIHLLDLYTKNEKSTLTPDQLKAVRSRMSQ